ncbi:MAG: hypothetical protein GY925_19245 [Actinomycetia bacterium]|nr:hypothetical protein [Actinomycetes bacterium]
MLQDEQVIEARRLLAQAVMLMDQVETPRALEGAVGVWRNEAMEALRQAGVRFHLADAEPTPETVAKLVRTCTRCPRPVAARGLCGAHLNEHKATSRATQAPGPEPAILLRLGEEA